jgi:hypothetical protein
MSPGTAMTPAILLVLAVAVVGVLHTAVPDHWVPITLIARQRGWSRGETARAALTAGTGHVVTTLLIAIVVWFAGVQFATRFGAVVDTIASIALVLFGGWIAVGAWRELHRGSGHGHSHGGLLGHHHREGHDHSQANAVDLDARKLVTSWPTRNASANFPMAFSLSPLLIASVFRSAPMLLLLDPVTGEERKRLSTCGDADDVFFDQHRARIYISCGAGEIAVLERKSADWAALGTIKTASGARTSLFVPELDRLFVAERAGLLGSDAAIRVYRPMQ